MLFMKHICSKFLNKNFSNLIAKVLLYQRYFLEIQVSIAICYSLDRFNSLAIIILKQNILILLQMIEQKIKNKNNQFNGPTLNYIMDCSCMVILFKDKVNGNTYRIFNGLNVKFLVDFIPQNKMFSSELFFINPEICF